jgi:hypothetical protein
LFFSVQEADAQLWRKIKKKTQQKVEDAAAEKVSDKAAEITAKEIEKILDAKINLFAAGMTKKDISDLPKKYSFDWKYQMEMQNQANEKKSLVYDFYLSSGNHYFAYGVPGESSVFVVIDPEHNAMIIYMDKEDHRQAMAFDIPDNISESSSDEADEQETPSFTKTKLPQKTFLGYQAEGVQYENEKYRFINYYTTKPNVALWGALTSNKVALSEDAKGLIKDQNALPLYMKYIDKTSTQNTVVLKGKKLEQIGLDKVNADYKFFNSL